MLFVNISWAKNEILSVFRSLGIAEFQQKERMKVVIVNKREQSTEQMGSNSNRTNEWSKKKFKFSNGDDSFLPLLLLLSAVTLLFLFTDEKISVRIRMAHTA